MRDNLKTDKIPTEFNLFSRDSVLTLQRHLNNYSYMAYNRLFKIKTQFQSRWKIQSQSVKSIYDNKSMLFLKYVLIILKSNLVINVERFQESSKTRRFYVRC